MNFKEVVDFLNHEDMGTETVVSPDEITLLTGLETIVGRAYRFTRSFKTPRDSMRWILWTLFYFVQQERELTDEEENVILEALADANANAAFCKKDEEQASTPKAAPEPEPQPAQAKGPGEKIKCPDTGKLVDDVADCPNCPHRQGCPQWD